MKSIKNQLLLSMSVSIIVVLSVIIGVVSITTYNGAMSQAYQLGEKEAEVASTKVRSQLEAALDTAKTLAYSFEGLKISNNADRTDMNGILENVLKQNPDFLGVWTVWEPNALDGNDNKYANTNGHDKTGRFIPYWYWSGKDTKMVPLEAYEEEGAGDYYLIAKNSGEETIVEPFFYEVDGKQVMMTSVVVPIKIDGKVLGVAGVDITLEKLQSLSDMIKIMDTGYGTILTNTGIYVAHPKTELVGTNIFDTELQHKSEIKQAVEQGTLHTSVQKSKTTGKTVNAVFSPIQIGKVKTPWSVATVVPIDEIARAAYQLIAILIILSILGVLFLVIIVWFIAGKISNPIKLATKHAQKIASLDITQNVPDIFMKRKDEIGELSNAFQVITDSMRVFIKDLAMMSQQVAASSEELTATTEQSSATLGEISKTIEEIANGASEQAKDTENAVGNITELGNLIEDDQKKLKELNDSINQVMIFKENSVQNMKRLVEKTESAQQASQEINEVISNANDSAEKIQSASQMIKNIADQTNLLSLNAAIEAARAGETGKGFAVVANEIGKLAEQSEKFTGEISMIINELKSKTESAVITMDEMNKVVNEQADSVRDTESKLEGIAAAIEKTKKVISILNDSGRSMANKKGDIITVIENLSAVSQENAAGTEETSATIEEQTEAMKQIANASDDLAKLAEDMNQNVAKFKF